MDGKAGAGRPQRRIDAAVKARFVAALRRGERREDAAAAVGFSLMGLYGARRRDPVFAAQWAEALAASAAAERRPLGDSRRGEVRIASANRRIYQRRRRRNLRFDSGRQALFLAHFAASCDTTAAAAQAGVHESTVHLHCRTDPAFAEAYREALAIGYGRLEAESVRRRLQAREKLRAAIDAAGRSARGFSRESTCPHCGTNLAAEADAEFDRILKLLARRDRKERKVERRFKQGGRRQPWTFEAAMERLEKKLRALGVRIPDPPDEEEQGEGGSL